MEEEKKGIGLFGLIGLVVSSCLGSGVFALTGHGLLYTSRCV